MPAAYAHYRFGKDVLGCLPFVYRKPVEKHRELYDIGLHGPDILFYNMPLFSNTVNQTGYAMHDQPAIQFFGKAAGVYKDAGGPDDLKAYLFGFVCHFTLDSICHPYIEKMMKDSGLSHSEIETELERYFMEKDGIDPAKYIPVQHIRASKQAADVIAPCFDPLTPAQIKSSLSGMILSLKLLHAPEDRKRSFLYIALKLTGNYASMQGLIMKPEKNEACGRYCRLLDNLYTEAVTVAASLVQQYANVLDHGAALSPRFHQTFGAGDNWEQLYI